MKFNVMVVYKNLEAYRMITWAVTQSMPDPRRLTLTVPESLQLEFKPLWDLLLYNWLNSSMYESIYKPFKLNQRLISMLLCVVVGVTALIRYPQVFCVNSIHFSIVR